MADRSIMVRLGAVASGLKQGLKEASTAAKLAAADIEGAGKRSEQAMKGAAKSAGLLSRVGSTITAQVGKLNALADEVSASREHVDRLGNSALVTGGLLAAGAALATKKFADFDAQISNVAATGIEARMSLSALRETAIELGADTVFSAEEAAQGIENMLKAGVSAKDVLAGGLKGALDLAAAGSLGVADAAEIAATALTVFKLSGSQMSHVADLLAAGAGKAQGEVSDLALALKYVGPVASGMGVSIEETVGALSAFASQGILADQAGTSLRGVLASLTSPSSAAQKEIDKLGITLYDSQGKFLGLSNMAGQLSKAYGTVTDEAKDASLGILFGNQQVTAARILFDQGAEGIQGWTDKVNEAGYAARAAATRMDNLKGDVERLSGAVDSALIQTGSGLNEMLRGITQSATGTVDAIGGIPGPVLSAGAKMTALAAAGLLVTAGLIKGVSAFSDYRESLRKISTDAPRTGKALGKLTTAAKVAGGAIAALQVVSIFGEMAQADIDKTRASLSDVAEVLAGMGAKGADAMAKLDGQFQSIESHFLWWQVGDQRVSGLADAIKQASAASSGFMGGLQGLYNAVEGIFGLKSVYVQTTEQIAKTDQALTSLDGTQAAAAFKQISDAALAQGTSIDTVLGYFPQYRATLQDTAVQLGVTNLSAQDYAAWMGGEVPAAVAAAANSQPDLVAKLSDTQQSLINATDSAKDLKAALWGAATAALKLSGSKIGFEAAIDDTTATIKGNQKNRGKGTNVGTSTSMTYKVNRENKQALDELAASTQAYVTALAEVPGGGDKAVAATQRGRDAYIAAAKAAGYSGTEAAKMADEMGLIPKNVRAEIDSTLNKDGVNDWKRYKPGTKTAWITPKLTESQLQAHINVLIRTGKISADGNLFEQSGAALGLVAQRFADGGFPSIGAQQPQIQPNHGARGIQWAETGSGPWEAFISGHPGKRNRSRTIASDVVGRLGGDVAWRNADGNVLRSALATPVHYQPGPTSASAGASGTADLAEALRAVFAGGVRAEFGSMSALSDTVAGRIVLAIERG